MSGTEFKSRMQAVIGSYPHTDGNFDRNNNFSTTIVDGSVAVPIDTINGFAGNVVYVIPASKSESRLSFAVLPALEHSKST